MKTFAEARPRDLALMLLATVALIAVVNAVSGEPLLSSTALLAIPLAAVMLAVLLVVARRRHGG